MLNKLTCNSCYKTIRKDFTPITCKNAQHFLIKNLLKILTTKHWLLAILIVVV